MAKEATKQRIGWIGAGRMGYAMAERLAKGGADVTVWNRTAAKAQPLAARGAKIARKLAELADCDVVFCMVSTWDDVKEVVAAFGGQETAHLDGCRGGENDTLGCRLVLNRHLG